jgi:DNA invertase Pin-like site-specific DNA recombinase
MNKIEDIHINRTAIIYIRQSTPEQIKNNDGSRMRQYNLKDKAMDMGFKNIKIIDEDLGISASGCYERNGFQNLLTEVCQERVGAIFAVEASRLARNGREWHTMLEFCGLVKTLIIDHDGIYDPRSPNDRLLLGMKGTISEMELTILRQRSQEAIKQKARLGKIFTGVAVGYVRVKKDRIEKDANKRVQEAIFLIFNKFRELMSARQVFIWFKQEKIQMPVVRHNEGERIVYWENASYSQILKILRNPIYAGAYVFGRTYRKIIFEGTKKRKVKKMRKNQKDWPFLIKDHHEGYINWEEYENNQKILTNNANMMSKVVKGSARKGLGILNGLLRCGRCGHKLYVYYSGNKGRYARYECKVKSIEYGIKGCISFSGVKIDRAVEKQVLEVLSPVGIEAALEAINKIKESEDEIIYQKELALKQARYEKERAKKQYNLVDPSYRLVAGELEKRWEEKLKIVRELEEDLLQIKENQRGMEALNKEELLELGKNLEYLWYHENCDLSIKKQILRTLIKEIIADVEDNKIKLVIHWEGGDHTKLEVPKNKKGIISYEIDTVSKEIMCELAKVMKDTDIAILLNRLGKKTGRGNTWNKQRVCSYRNQYSIPIFKKEELEKHGEILVKDAAEKLGVVKRRIYTLIEKKVLPAKRACFGAPWVIQEKDINKPEVRFYCENINKTVTSSVPEGQLELFSCNIKK